MRWFKKLDEVLFNVNYKKSGFVLELVVYPIVLNAILLLHSFNAIID